GVAGVDLAQVALNGHVAEVAAGGVDVADVRQPVAAGGPDDADAQVGPVEDGVAQVDEPQLFAHDAGHTGEEGAGDVAAGDLEGDQVAVDVGVGRRVRVDDQHGRSQAGFQGLNAQTGGRAGQGWPVAGLPTPTRTPEEGEGSQDDAEHGSCLQGSGLK